MGRPDHLVAIDVGNTRTSVGFFVGGKLVARRDVETSAAHRLFNKLDRSGAFKHSRAIICSVVPEKSIIVNNMLRSRRKKQPPLMFGTHVNPLIKTTYRRIKTLGADRRANVCYLRSMFGHSALIFDFGTAVTCDWLDRRGRYRGGLIFPGMSVGLRALAKDTALLPKVQLQKGKKARFPGVSTSSSMESGVLLGYASVVEGLVRRFEQQQGGRLRVVVTGGEGHFVLPYVKVKHRVLYDRDATLKGIRAGYELWRKGHGQRV